MENLKMTFYDEHLLNVFFVVAKNFFLVEVFTCIQ